MCVFLFGGNDSNNVIVPLGAEQYRGYSSARGGLALPQASLLPVTTPSGAAYGLHPRLADLQQLFNRKKLAIVANVGMLTRPTTRDQYRQRAAPLPSNLFSHSDQQTQWQSSYPDTSSRTGWGGRTADFAQQLNTDRGFTAVSLSGNTIFLEGKEARPALVAVGGVTGLSGYNDTAPSQARLRGFLELLNINEGSALVQILNDTALEGLRISQVLSAATTGASGLATRFPATTLGRQLESVARIIRMRGDLGVNRQVFFCSLGGFDTHINQLATHESLLSQLGPALAAFHASSQELGVENQVTAFTESEFGRTLQPSSGAGSDHGWGSHHLVVGGAVKGGDVYGQFPVVATGGPDDATGRGVWVPTTSVDQYAAALAAWFGMDESAVAELLPTLANFPQQSLGFLG
ncbi:MAG: DUF1501 domain-containing protein [Acidobacteria bacterium]|nr:DUF1501 domain-containing protein [Acidobacteriota bacterium]